MKKGKNLHMQDSWFHHQRGGLKWRSLISCTQKLISTYETKCTKNVFRDMKIRVESLCPDKRRSHGWQTEESDTLTTKDNFSIKAHINCNFFLPQHLPPWLIKHETGMDESISQETRMQQLMPAALTNTKHTLSQWCMRQMHSTPGHRLTTKWKWYKGRE